MRDDVAGEDEEEVDSQISASDKGQDRFDTGRYVLLRVHREHEQRCQRRMPVRGGTYREALNV
jgi:hypothetical protein